MHKIIRFISSLMIRLDPVSNHREFSLLTNCLYYFFLFVLTFITVSFFFVFILACLLLDTVFLSRLTFFHSFAIACWLSYGIMLPVVYIAVLSKEIYRIFIEHVPLS
jgi:hypothetical protein